MQFVFGNFDFYNSKEPPRSLSKFCHVEKEQVEGRNVFTLSPLSNGSGNRILYLHGGAYVQSFVRQHWSFLLMLVRRTRCTVVAPDYPLAPANTYKQAFKMVDVVYDRMLQAANNAPIFLMGDSAGGGFALAFAQKLSFDKVVQPAKIILLSPWLDITLQNPDVEIIDRLDPFLNPRSLRKAGAVYAGDLDPNHFMLSPINGPLNLFGSISIFIGSRDVLAADARKIKRLADEAGVQVNYREYPDMVHVWMLLNFPESRRSREEIIELVLK